MARQNKIQAIDELLLDSGIEDTVVNQIRPRIIPSLIAFASTIMSQAVPESGKFRGEFLSAERSILRGQEGTAMQRRQLTTS